MNRDVMFCDRPIGDPLTYSLRRDDSDFVVFCFGKPENAEDLPSTLVARGLAVRDEQRRA
jgi:hypothetical protein